MSPATEETVVEPAARYLELARDLGVEVRIEEPLSRHTTAGIGGPAALFFSPRTIDSAAALFAELSRGPLPVRILGGGSNLLVADEGVRAAVVSTDRLSGEPEPESESDARVRVPAGAPVPGLARWAARAGRTGLEFAEGIPAQLGGAIRMNAGANRSEFSAVVREVLLAGRDGAVVRRRVGPGDFAYRDSFAGRERAFVLGAVLELPPGDREAIRRAMLSYRQRRRRTQPVTERSSGCIFANFPDAPIGALVERLGLRGATRGGAAISERHGNFIVNRGGARFDDVWALIERMRAAIVAETGREPRLEVEVWRDEEAAR